MTPPCTLLSNFELLFPGHTHLLAAIFSKTFFSSSKISLFQPESILPRLFGILPSSCLSLPSAEVTYIQAMIFFHLSLSFSTLALM